MDRMDQHTLHLFRRLLPKVTEIAYHDMHLSTVEMNDEDLQDITYQICSGPLHNNLSFWGYESGVNQMDMNADWQDITDAIKRSIAEYMEQHHIVVH